MSDVNELGADLAESELSVSTQIPIKLYNRKTSRFFKLINNTDSSSIKLNRQPYALTFKLPQYIEMINIEVEGNAKNNFLIKAYKDGKEVKSLTLECEDGNGKEYIDKIVDKITVEHKTFIRKHKVSSINLYGYENFKFERLEKEIYKATLLRGKFDKEYGNKIKEINEKEEALNQKVVVIDAQLEKSKVDIADKNTELDEVNSQIDILKKQKASLTIDISGKKERLSIIEKKHSSLQERNDSLDVENKDISGEIREKDKQLKELTNNVNLFTDEISSFAKESNKHIRTYLTIAIIPFFIMSYITLELLEQGVNFLSFYKEESVYDVWEIFLARLPFVMISIFLIETSFFIIWSIYKRIINIHQQRLSLSKLSIIARDISDNACDGLESLTDEDIYQLRTTLKMDFLKSHLIHELGENYKHTPLKEKNNRFLGVFSKKNALNEDENSNSDRESKIKK